jgi:hypothetical protein
VVTPPNLLLFKGGGGVLQVSKLILFLNETVLLCTVLQFFD